ncbi:hypothetical protein GCM10017690_08430 [Microbacterium terregens]
MLVHEAIVPNSEASLTSILLTTALPIILFWFIARDRGYLEQSIIGLTTVVVVVAALSLVSFAVGAIIGFGATHVANVPLGYSDRGVGLLLPGGFTYGGTLSEGFPRMLGLGREPGMGAIYYAWAFFAIPATWRHRSVLRWVVLLGALLTTQSTAGVALFTISLALWVVFGRDRIRPLVALLALGASAAIAYLAIFDTSFGVLSKLETTSYDERNAATLRGLEALQLNFWDSATTLPLSNVNLIAGVDAHGGPWLVILGVLLITALIRSGRQNPMTYAALFIALTVLASQPIIDTPAILIMLFICVASRPVRPAPELERLEPAERRSVTKSGSDGSRSATVQ